MKKWPKSLLHKASPMWSALLKHAHHSRNLSSVFGFLWCSQRKIMSHGASNLKQMEQNLILLTYRHVRMNMSIATFAFIWKYIERPWWLEQMIRKVVGKSDIPDRFFFLWILRSLSHDCHPLSAVTKLMLHILNILFDRGLDETCVGRFLISNMVEEENEKLQKTRSVFPG